MRILVIETQFQAGGILKAMLDSRCRIIKIREAANVCEALHLLEKFQPLVILLDVRMPKKNGLEAISLVKEKYQSFKIVVLSMDPDLKSKSLAAGADSFVNKSDSPEKLWEALADILHEYRWTGAVQQSVRDSCLEWEPTKNCTYCEE